MANGLICQETLTSTPNYKIKPGNHPTYNNTRTNYVSVKNTSCSPPDYLTSQLAPPPACLTGEITPPPAYPSFPPPTYNQFTSLSSSMDLMCHESVSSAPSTPAKPNQNGGRLAHPAGGRPGYELNFQHPPVKADCDRILLKDNRVLQNLLKSEDRYLSESVDYFKYVQSDIKPHMRKIVADWMLEVCQELCCQPEVFCLAVSLMDRFLSTCRISKNQLQLLGCACLFLSSKFKAVDHICSDKLVFYTDYSITIQELKEWELLVLQELHWELSCTTPLDYLDHILPRLQLPTHVDVHRLRLKTETIAALSATHNQFCNRLPSQIATASIYTALASCNNQIGDVKLESILSITKESCTAINGGSPRIVTAKELRENRLCLQILTHVGSETLDRICSEFAECLPNYLTGAKKMLESGPNSPDTTTGIISPDSPDMDDYETPLDQVSSLDMFTDLSKSMNISSPTASDDFQHNSILVT